MRYAVISDIHGNMLAFEAVLEDAKQQGVNGLILLGDYCGFSNTNIVAEKIGYLLECSKRCDNFHVFIISGNGEEYIRHNYDRAKKEAFPKQNAPIHHECNSISEENKNFLLGLPKRLEKEICGTKIYMSHSPTDLFGKSVADSFGGRSYIDLMREHKLENCTYHEYVRHKIEEDTGFIEQIQKMKEDIFLFGHFHTQWHANIGDKLIINPGACGLPCDYQTTAPYTILERSCDRWVVQERRVFYDVEQAVLEFRKTEAYSNMNIWSELHIKVMQIGINAPILFLEHANAIMEKHGEHESVCPDWIWEEAILSFDMDTLNE